MTQKPKSSYSYSIRGIQLTSHFRKVIVIEDKNVGMSVTNDIENVVAEICEEEQLNAKECLIIYRDSEGIWDGWDATTDQFVPLQERDEQRAVNKYRDRLNQKQNDS